MRYKQETWKEFAKTKIIAQPALSFRIDPLRSQGKTVATINGSFDLLHAGHLHILYEASKTADILIVALNTDESIKRYKNKSRPIIDLQDRLEMVAALSFVDFVTWFEEDDPRNILRLIQPDVHVNGAEYGAHCIEAEVVREGGGRLHLVERIPGLATSDIITTIKNLCDDSGPQQTVMS